MSEGEKLLRSIYYEQRELTHLLQIREEKRLSTLPGSLAPRDVLVQTPRKADPLGDAVVDVVFISEAIAYMTERLRQRKEVALDTIKQLDVPRHRTILLLRYFEITDDGRRPEWAEIAEVLGYSYRHTTKMHRAALEAFNRAYASRPCA